MRRNPNLPVRTKRRRLVYQRAIPLYVVCLQWQQGGGMSELWSSFVCPACLFLWTMVSGDFFWFVLPACQNDKAFVWFDAKFMAGTGKPVADWGVLTPGRPESRIHPCVVTSSCGSEKAGVMDDFCRFKRSLTSLQGQKFSSIHPTIDCHCCVCHHHLRRRTTTNIGG